MLALVGVEAPARISANTRLSHVRIIRASTAFGRDPVDVLGRILDVTGLAVNAILRVDLEPWLTAFSFDKFVNAGRAISLLGSVVIVQVDRRRYLRVLERQMNGL